MAKYVTTPTNTSLHPYTASTYGAKNGGHVVVAVATTDNANTKVSVGGKPSLAGGQSEVHAAVSARQEVYKEVTAGELQ